MSCKKTNQAAPGAIDAEIIFREMPYGLAQYDIYTKSKNSRLEFSLVWRNAAFTKLTELQPNKEGKQKEISAIDDLWSKNMQRVFETRETLVFEHFSPMYGKHLQISIFPSGHNRLICMVAEISRQAFIDTEHEIATVALNIQDPMVITDANTIIRRVNSAFTEITGYGPDEVIGKTPAILKSWRHDREFYEEMWNSINLTGRWQGEIWDRRKNGEEYLKWLNISVVKDTCGDITNYIGIQHDVSERRTAREKVYKLAFFDQLTGLPNRTLLIDRLKQVMSGNDRRGIYGALLLIDLDNFKLLNDTLGHDMGDQLLKQAAVRLKESVREEDIVARLGGDEFVVILSFLGNDKNEALRRVDIVGEKLLATFNKGFSPGGLTYHITPSIGTSLFRGRQTEIDVLLKQADLAMYRAKAAGRNSMRYFDRNMEIAAMKRAAVENGLRCAINTQQFLLHYQAQVQNGRIAGAEALVRWQHPEKGIISPVDFIPVAEDTGLILHIGRWVLKTVCRKLAEWQKNPKMRHITIAVNVSANQFRQADFVDQVSGIVAETEADPCRLKIELTESMLVSNIDDVIEKMTLLKLKGIGFSLDDFGTGYSSLTYLKRLPLDYLKIDKSFVRDILNDPNDASIARTVIALAKNLGIGVIGEGVENVLQKHFLEEAGCDTHQGFFYSRPLHVEEFEKMVEENLAEEIP